MEAKVLQENNVGNIQPFGMKDKVGYMLGDLSNNLFFSLISSYLMVFYTDVVGLAPAAIGTMLVVSRVWDAINDPMMGALVDKRKPGKNGKFRPYLIGMSLPITIMGILTFMHIPSLSDSSKLIYAYVTYIGFGMCYTAINIPYGSLGSVMTSDPIERTSLSTFRTLGGLIANIIIMAVVPALVLNGENGAPTAQGFITCALIFAVASNILYFLTYKMTTERIQHAAKKAEEKISLVETLKALGKNRALLGLILSSLGVLSATYSVQTLNIYLYKDYFGTAELVGLAGMVTMVATMAAFPVVGKLVAKFGKKEASVGGVILSVGAYAILYILKVDNPYVFMGIVCVSNFGLGIYSVLIWAMVSDAIDYHEFIADKREEGTIYAAYSFSRKLSQAVAGGIGGFALAFIGYEASATVQTPEVLEGIRTVSTLLPAVFVAVGFVGIAFLYNLSKTRLEEVNTELNSRR